MVKKKIAKKDFRKVKLLVLDFDGVMTDNKVYVNEDGKEMVCCSRGDGLGIENLKKIGIKILVISKEENKVVTARCKKLRVSSVQGIDNKLRTLKQVLKKLNIPPSQVCYLGNDINDVECVKLAGFGCAVRDAHPTLLKVVDYTTKNKGGNGAIREICDLIMKSSSR